MAKELMRCMRFVRCIVLWPATGSGALRSERCNAGQSPKYLETKVPCNSYAELELSGVLLFKRPRERQGELQAMFNGQTKHMHRGAATWPNYDIGQFFLSKFMLTSDRSWATLCASFGTLNSVEVQKLCALSALYINFASQCLCFAKCYLKLILCNKCNVHVTCLMCMLHHSRCGPSRWSLDITRLSMGLLDGLKTPRNFSSGDGRGRWDWHGHEWPPLGNHPTYAQGKVEWKGDETCEKIKDFKWFQCGRLFYSQWHFHWDHWGFLTAWSTFWNSSSVSAHSTIRSTISALKLENHRWEQQAPNQGHKEWELRLLAPFET